MLFFPLFFCCENSLERMLIIAWENFKFRVYFRILFRFKVHCLLVKSSFPLIYWLKKGSNITKPCYISGFINFNHQAILKHSAIHVFDKHIDMHSFY